VARALLVHSEAQLDLFDAAFLEHFGGAEGAGLALARELLDIADASATTIVTDGILTPRELEIAWLVSYGLTNRAIAAELRISEGTVRAHVEHILGKLSLQSRAEVAARLAAETGGSKTSRDRAIR
jgi:DNA-binding NarL/FixJ family response regulator